MKKNTKYDIAIVAPAIRVQNWMQIYKSLYPTKYKFQIIFAGPNIPNFKLPNNFFFIHTFVKPSQCMEILFRESKARYTMYFSDDCIFATKNPIDIIMNELKKINNKKILLGMRYFFRNKEQTHIIKININGTNSELLPMMPPIKHNLWNKYGHFDKRFIATLYEADFLMRLITSGYKVQHSKVIVKELKILEGSSKISNYYLMHDTKIVKKLWCDNINGGIYFKKNRNDKIKKFNNKNIKIISQGPSGKWRFTNIIIKNILKNNFFNILYNCFHNLSLKAYNFREFLKNNIFINYKKK